MNPRRLARTVGLYATAVFACVVAIFPVYRIVSMSFMQSEDTFAIPPKWIFKPTLDSYHQLFSGYQGLDVQLYLRNSLIVALGSTTLTLLVTLLGAYATASFRFRGREMAVTVILITRMLPPIAMVVPTFLYLYQIGLLDTQVGLIAVYTALNIPFAFWMLHGFIMTVPPELIDAAQVDGCTKISALTRIVVPLLGPGLVAAAAFAFILSWNDFALAAVLTTSQAKTLPLMILSFQGPEGTAWGPMAAGATVAITPPVLLLLISQRWMVKGLTLGATKG
jgi:multiple sugar transport system permease protein